MLPFGAAENGLSAGNASGSFGMPEAVEAAFGMGLGRLILPQMIVKASQSLFQAAQQQHLVFRRSRFNRRDGLSQPGAAFLKPALHFTPGRERAQQPVEHTPVRIRCGPLPGRPNIIHLDGHPVMGRRIAIDEGQFLLLKYAGKIIGMSRSAG